MQFKIRNQEDFWSGLMFMAFGIIAIVVASDYPMGSAMRMGPGYFPTHIGGLMVLLGAIVTVLSFKTAPTKVGGFNWRAMILLAIAFAILGWGIDHIGFIPSLFILIVLSALAGKEFRVKEVLILSVVLIIGSWALFIWGLELAFPLFWWR